MDKNKGRPVGDGTAQRQGKDQETSHTESPDGTQATALLAQFATDKSREIYGSLKEGLHIAGYSFERACMYLEILLQEDLWRLDGQFNDVNAFLDSVRLDEFRTTIEQRKRIVTLIKDLQPKASNRQIARTLGVGHQTVGRDTGPNGPTSPEKPNQNKAASEPRGPNGPPPELSGAQTAKLGINRAATMAHRAAIAAQAAAGGVTAAPTDKYRIIYADPPWSYANNQPDYFGEQRDHYPVMELDQICALPVKEWVEDDAVLFLWATAPILEESFQVVDAWGFKYKALFVWDKIKHVMGHYNSVRCELLLICVRGSCQPDVKQLIDNVQSIERSKHSAKPVEFYDIIETLYTHGRRLNIFAREQREGWDVYGHVAEIAEATDPVATGESPASSAPDDDLSIPGFLRRAAS